jgi:hypothetical protein
MGNCCCTRLQRTDNNVENLIQETIHSLKIREENFETFDENIKHIINSSITDILPNEIHKWISSHSYDEILNSYILNIDHNDGLQIYACPNYENVVYNSLNRENKNYFILWLISHTKTNYNSSGRRKKIKLIKNYIVKLYKVITFSSFEFFLKDYIYFNLFSITQNFNESQFIKNDNNLNEELSDLLNNVYRQENIEKFTNFLLSKMKDKLSRSSKKFGIESKKKDLSNEYLDEEKHLAKYFEENSLVLDILELRNEFFTKFSLNYNSGYEKIESY